MRVFLSVIVMHIFYCGFSQSFNMNKMAQVTGMPGSGYSAVFGYTDTQGNEFAIIGSTMAINIFNVNNCSNPVNVLTHTDTYNTSWREFSSYQNYVYGICDGNCQSGLKIINMNNMVVTSQTSVFTKGHTIFVEQSKGRLYVMGSGSRMLIFTLDTETVNGITYFGTAANPVLIKDFATSYIHDMYVRDNIGYASHGYNGYKIWDLNNAFAPQLLASIDDATGYNHSSWLNNTGEYAYVAEEVPRGKSMKILKKTGSGLSTSVNLVGSFKDPIEGLTSLNNRPHNPHIVGNLLYISYYEDGVQVFDITDPTLPKRVAYYDTYSQNNGNGYPCDNCWGGCWGVYPFLSSGCILGSDLDNGLFTMRMDMPNSDGNNPGVVAKIENGDVIFESSTNGIVLRSDQGYCYRMKIDNSGFLTTERIICQVNGTMVQKVVKGDLAFSSSNFSLILKDQDSQCKKIRMNTNGTIAVEDVACNFNPSKISIQNSDLVIETYTKGLILKNSNGICYRITVNNTGGLQTLALNTCP